MDADDKELLREWLTRSLEPVCDADPEVLSKYVLALVQNDPQKPGLQETCVSKLEEFLGDETPGFVSRLFKVLADGSYKASASRASQAPSGSDERNTQSNRHDSGHDRHVGQAVSEEEEERRRAGKRHRDDDRAGARGADSKRHQGSPRREQGGRRQPFPPREGGQRGGMPMAGGRGGSGAYGDRRHNFPPEWGMPPPGMWPPHFPPQGAGYPPPDFDPNMYNPEAGGMIPPPQMGMMMPRHMGGRGQFFGPGGGRGGRGRGGYYPGRGGREGENGGVEGAKTTLRVSNVDPKYVNMTKLSLHFSKFGNVVNVQMRPSFKCAYVQYASEEEARKAFHSPIPVCNNRFIEVKWAKYDARDPQGAPSVAEQSATEKVTKEPSASGEDNATATAATGEQEDGEKQAEGEAETAPEKTMTPEELRAAALEKGRQVLEQKRELLEKQRALRKQKEALLKRQLAQHKEMLERMSQNSAQFSVADKRDLLNKITSLSEDLKALTPRHATVSPSATRPAEAGESLSGLQAELSALEAEAAGGRGPGGRGAGGRWAGAGRGYRGGRGGRGRGRGGFGQHSNTLDNRTTIVKVANLPEEARDPIVLTQHFGNFGAVERVVVDDAAPDRGFIKFQDRYAGQAALSHGAMYGDKQLEMTWVDAQEAPAELTRSDGSPTTASADTGASTDQGEAGVSADKSESEVPPAGA